MITSGKASKIVPNVVMIILTLLCVLPMLLLLMASFTDEATLTANGYSFFPEKFSTASYEYIFKASNTVFRAYGITFLVTIVGTACNIVFTIGLAYPLSRPELKGRNVLAFLVFFTMLFNGGLVPTYIIYSQVFHIRDTIFALLVPTFMMSAFNVILMRNYFKTNIPDAIIEAAHLDGASELRTLINVVLPISTPIIGTIGLMAGLAYWNDWMNGLYYINDDRMYSIQVLLMNIQRDLDSLRQQGQSGGNVNSADLPSTSVRMALTVMGVLPIMIIYPFVQKYFVKGIAIGAVKG